MATKPDWYPDPQNPQELRWWDGQGWTEDRLTSAMLLKRIADSQEKSRRSTQGIRWGLFGIAILILIYGIQILDVLNRIYRG